MSRCPVLVPPMDTLIGELAAVIGETGVKRRLPQIEVAVGDSAAAIVLRVLEPPGPEDRARFEAFGREHGIDVYLQTGGPGSIEPLAPPRPLGYALPEFDVELEFEPTDFVPINADVNRRQASAAGQPADGRPVQPGLRPFCGAGHFTQP